jgi:hypothetical protein
MTSSEKAEYPELMEAKKTKFLVTRPQPPAKLLKKVKGWQNLLRSNSRLFERGDQRIKN